MLDNRNRDDRIQNQPQRPQNYEPEIRVIPRMITVGRADAIDHQNKKPEKTGCWTGFTQWCADKAAGIRTATRNFANRFKKKDDGDQNDLKLATMMGLIGDPK
jgi:hypothetical protein